MSVDNWRKAAEIAPPSAYTEQEWVDFWKDNPETLLQMLGDLYRVYKHEQLKEAGKAPRAGRRKKAIDGNIDELFAILTPQYSTKPFGQALKDIQGDRSLRQMAMRSGLQHKSISRWILEGGHPRLRGSGGVDRAAIEALAKALKVHPAYFAEWRSDVVAELVRDVFQRQPNLSISFLKAMAMEGRGG